MVFKVIFLVIKILTVTWLALSLSVSVYAYELGTHGRITEQAYINSGLTKDTTLLINLGLSNLNTAKPLGEIYYDISGSNMNVRKANPFSTLEKRMPNPDVEAFTFKGWLMRGAIREDDHKDIEVCNYYSANPDEDDPYLVSRPLNHFYDPVNDRPLRGFFGLFNLGKKAPDWALGTSDFISAPNTPDTSRNNHFSTTGEYDYAFI